jgi:hypothetical protein
MDTVAERLEDWNLRRLVPRAAGTLLATIVALVLGACGGHTQAIHPMDPGELATTPGWIVAAPTPDIRQRVGAEGGAATLAMVAGRWLVPTTLDDALEVTPVSTDLRVTDLKESATSLGLDSHIAQNDIDVLEFELRAHRPVIVSLKSRDAADETFNHFEVVIAINPRTGEVASLDPRRGWRIRQIDELDADWKPLGRPALVVVGRSAESLNLKDRPRRKVVLNVAERHRPEAWPSR